MRRDSPEPARFGPGAVFVVIAWHDPDCLLGQIDVGMTQPESLADAPPGVVQQHDQKGVPQQLTGLDQLQDLLRDQTFFGDLPAYEAEIAAQIPIFGAGVMRRWPILSKNGLYAATVS